MEAQSIATHYINCSEKGRQTDAGQMDGISSCICFYLFHHSFKGFYFSGDVLVERAKGSVSNTTAKASQK